MIMIFMQITKITSVMKTKNWIQHAPRKNWSLKKQYCCNDQQRLDESLSKDWNQNYDYSKVYAA